MNAARTKNDRAERGLEAVIAGDPDFKAFDGEALTHGVDAITNILLWIAAETGSEESGRLALDTARIHFDAEALEA